MAIQVNTTPSYLQDLGAAALTAYPATMVCFSNVPNITQFHPLLFVGDSTGSNFVNLMARGDVGGDPAQIIINNSNLANTTAAYVANVFQHFCTVLTSATSRSVYIEGGNKATDTVSKALTNYDRTAIGRRISGPLEPQASVDFAWICIWSVALTDEEVLALSDGAWPFHVRPDKITHWIPLPRTPDYQDLVGGLTFSETGTLATVESPSLASHFMAA